MGWLFRKEPVDDVISHLKLAVRENFGSSEFEVIDIACVNSVAYLAVRVNEVPSYVTGVVIPFRNDAERGFGYKIIDETLGPVYCECPDHIMKQLSPIGDLPANGYARKWRKDVEREMRSREREEPAAKRRDRYDERSR